MEVIRAKMFEKCSALNTIEFAQKGLKKIEANAFSGCKALKKIEIPAGVESIGQEVFFDCQNLSEIILKAGLKELGDRVFADCYRLVKINLPDTLLSIGNEAFFDCLMLSRIILPSSTTTLGKSIFESDRPFEGVESSDAFYAPTDGYGLYGEEDGEEYTVTVDNHLSYPDGFVLGVDDEECVAAQYARENNIPYEVVTDVEEFLNVERPEIYHIYEMRMKDRNKQTEDDEPW
jgi:hypothetical protein